MPASRNRKNLLLGLILVSAVFIFLRLNMLGHLLMWDEARNILSLKAFLCNLKSSQFYGNIFFHPPLYMAFAALLSPFRALFDIRLELLSLLFSYAVLISVYLLSARTGGWKYAALSGLFLSVMPVSIGYDTWIKRDGLASAFGYLAVLLLCRRKFLWCAIALSFSLLSKESALFFMLSCACILFLMKEKKAPQMIAAACGIIFALTSWWYIFFSSMPKDVFDLFFSIKNNIGTWANSPYYYFKKLAPDMGIPLLFFFIIGISRLLYLAVYKKQYRFSPPLMITLCVYIPASFFIAAKTPWLCLSAAPALAMTAGCGALFLLSMALRSKFQLLVFGALVVFAVFIGSSFSYSGYHMKTYPNGWPGAHSSRELALYLSKYGAGPGERLMITEFAYWKMPECPVFSYYWEEAGGGPIEIIRGSWTPQMVIKEMADKKMSWFVIADSPDPENNFHAFVKEMADSALGKPAIVEWAYVWKAGAAVNAHADGIVTGANISAGARAAIEPMKPGSTFDTQNLPPAPDYALPDAWAALPDKKDNADLAPLNTKYPESQSTAAADVFFIHPTTAATARDNWNIPIDDTAAVREIENILGFCASSFNAAAKVYAPRYREANLYAFFDDKTVSGIKAVDLAYRDVERAFLHYIKFYNQGRPFILAGHSQGSLHASRLLQEHIIGTPLMDRMVGAYLIGGTTPAKIPGIQPSRSATDTGTLIGWNTYTKEGDPAIFTDGIIGWIGGSYKTMLGRPLIQVNPLSWELNGPEVPASRNPGSLPFLPESAGTPLLVGAVCGADASGEVLIINKPEVPGFAVSEAGDMPVLNAKYGDYHSFDYTLFYESIRKNAIDRVKAFKNR